ncbi:thiamine phosphate synthase [Psychrobacter phenylpyruvicus]|uniref:Thiamine-phosphate synthase n=1 Tax=Psychrobacter phenylpyruvicus TaxID=29432 RepID=A0A379LN49_9GAMM|nr:thiamine phosphate synthase [Psychrobacter phenylpyruvicus]SUD91204.1 Thiamine-phosphate synthase [Psychrobacter phenylpyruvicus]
MTSAANASITLSSQHQASSASSNDLMDKSGSALKLYLVTDSVMCQQLGLIETVCAAIEGGVSFVQLRDKQADDEQLYQIACELKEAIAGRTPLVINDRVHIAKKANLDGAHIGQGDLSVTEARQILGPDAWLGLSINTLSQLQHAHNHHLDQLDYFGLGPVFATNTKPNHARPLGISGLDDLAQASLLPSVAIGGINLDNARSVYQTHCDGIAVVSAICGANDPKIAAQNLLQQHFLAQ